MESAGPVIDKKPCAVRVVAARSMAAFVGAWSLRRGAANRGTVERRLHAAMAEHCSVSCLRENAREQGRSVN